MSARAKSEHRSENAEQHRDDGERRQVLEPARQLRQRPQSAAVRDVLQIALVAAPAAQNEQSHVGQRRGGRGALP